MCPTLYSLWILSLDDFISIDLFWPACVIMFFPWVLPCYYLIFFASSYMKPLTINFWLWFRFVHSFTGWQWPTPVSTRSSTTGWMPGAVSRTNWTSTCCFNQRFRDYFDKVLFGCPRLLRWAQKRQKIYEVPLDTAKTLNNMQNTTEYTDHTFTFLWQPHFGFVRVVWCCTFMMDWSRLPQLATHGVMHFISFRNLKCQMSKPMCNIFEE